MSLEDQITRLTNVISMSQEGSAVAEIIRQRDAAQKWAKQCESDAEYYRQRSSEHYNKRIKVERQCAALRGVITRMKKARSVK